MFLYFLHTECQNIHPTSKVWTFSTRRTLWLVLITPKGCLRVKISFGCGLNWVWGRKLAGVVWGEELVKGITKCVRVCVCACMRACMTSVHAYDLSHMSACVLVECVIHELMKNSEFSPSLIT